MSILFEFNILVMQSSQFCTSILGHQWMGDKENAGKHALNEREMTCNVALTSLIVLVIVTVLLSLRVLSWN